MINSTKKLVIMKVTSNFVFSNTMTLSLRFKPQMSVNFQHYFKGPKIKKWPFFSSGVDKATSIDVRRGGATCWRARNSRWRRSSARKTSFHFSARKPLCLLISMFATSCLLLTKTSARQFRRLEVFTSSKIVIGHVGLNKAWKSFKARNTLTI